MPYRPWRESEHGSGLCRSTRHERRSMVDHIADSAFRPPIGRSRSTHREEGGSKLSSATRIRTGFGNPSISTGSCRPAGGNVGVGPSRRGIVSRHIRCSREHVGALRVPGEPVPDDESYVLEIDAHPRIRRQGSDAWLCCEVPQDARECRCDRFTVESHVRDWLSGRVSSAAAGEMWAP